MKLRINLSGVCRINNAADAMLPSRVTFKAARTHAAIAAHLWPYW
jgi:hypothetical protein